MWDFIVFQLKFNRFLHLDEYPERFFLGLIMRLEEGLTKFAVTRAILVVHTAKNIRLTVCMGFKFKVDIYCKSK